MSTATSKAKSELRQEMLALRNALPLEEKQQYDQWVYEQLKLLVQERQVKVLHSYLPMQGEIDVLPFLHWAFDKGLKIICPKVLPQRKLEHLELIAFDQLETGRFNTTHPAGNKVYRGPLDLILVPGLAFDNACNRLGYGGGFYDNFMASKPEAYKLALLYPFQNVAGLPTEAHDVKVDGLITDH